MNFTAMGPEARAKKAEEIGYRSIGADLPDGIALAEIVRSMPKEVQQISWAKLAPCILQSTWRL